MNGEINQEKKRQNKIRNGIKLSKKQKTKRSHTKQYKTIKNKTKQKRIRKNLLNLTFDVNPESDERVSPHNSHIFDSHSE